MIRFDKDICQDFATASSREWLETNGIGGFASATISGLNRRRYHGLLTAATKPPVGRMVLLSKLEETLVIGDRRIDLATNQYDGAVHPQGFQHISSFRLDPFPVTTFEVEGIVIEKSVFMVQGSNATVVQYRLTKASAAGTVQHELRPLLAYRDYHGTAHENSSINAEIKLGKNLVTLSPYQGAPQLFIAHSTGDVIPQGFWYRNFLFETERERGLDFKEDMFNPLVLRFVLSKTEPVSIIASTEQHDIANVEKYRAAEVDRRKKIEQSAAVNEPFVVALTVAADQYLARRGENWTVLAGYPWFTDWGRDTMIALPGLTLFNGNAEIARGVLLSFAESVSQGMLPNRFPDSGEEAEYNTVDATLWFFEAVRAYAAATGDYEFVREKVYPKLSQIIDCHVRGTRYGIHMLENGLLNAGEPGVQLTWMDAKIGDWVVTPRSGKPVEIQALWFNAMKIMEDLAQRFGFAEEQKRCRTISSMTQWSFNRVFWNEQANCLYDVTNGGAPDASIRPNQIFAVSLHHSMLSPERARAVVEVVERELLTPYGLRSLSPADPRYRGKYAGDPYHRDSVYHQGTVWPWLMGPFVTALVKVNGGTKHIRHRAAELLQPLAAYMSDAGVGQIPEVFDGDMPQNAGGCFAQAWSVAEVLRALCEDVHQVNAGTKIAPRKQALKRSPAKKKAGAGR
jgi:predicted glycogen debranching enzyme